MRKFKQKLQRIDINELFNNSSNRGMLSFLERPPEEAQARLLEKQKADEIDAMRLDPTRKLHPEGELRVGLSSNEFSAIPFPAERNPLGTATEPRQPSFDPRGTSPLGVVYGPHSDRAKMSTAFGVGNLPLGVSDREQNLSLNPVISAAQEPQPESHRDVSYTEGELLPGLINGLLSGSEGKTSAAAGIGNLPPGVPPHERTLLLKPVISDARILPPESYRGAGYTEGKLPPGPSALIDGSVVGRRQKIRRATVAQDGHSSGEQVLYQSLWNAGSPETNETRLIAIGYNGMSSLCKLEKSNCKKNIQSLLEKLAVEISASYQSATSTGTTYRVFSYKEILRRREAAGLIWVIRTSGVRFVNPLGDLPRPPASNLPIAPVSEAHTAPMGEAPRGPVCKTPTHLVIDRSKEIKTSSSAIYQALSEYGPVDDDGLDRLLQCCKAQVPDCTDQEIIHFIHEKGSLVRGRERRIYNPIGFLLTAVPKCFASESFRLYRQDEKKRRQEDTIRESSRRAELEEWDREQKARLADPAVPEEDKQLIRKWLRLT